jgi:hypothetical protein
MAREAEGVRLLVGWGRCASTEVVARLGRCELHWLAAGDDGGEEWKRGADLERRLVHHSGNQGTRMQERGTRHNRGQIVLSKFADLGGRLPLMPRLCPGYALLFRRRTPHISSAVFV